FRPTAYGVREDTGRIDYDQVREIARRERPRILVGGGSAYARVIDFAALRSVADEVGAIFVVDMAHFAGLVAAGIHPSPVPHAQLATTTTHKTLRGPRGGLILCEEQYGMDGAKQVFPGIQGGPLEYVIAGMAVALGGALSPAPWERGLLKSPDRAAATQPEGTWTRGTAQAGGSTCTYREHPPHAPDAGRPRRSRDGRGRWGAGRRRRVLGPAVARLRVLHG